MASFGRRSQAQLRTCNPLLQAVLEEVVVWFDCSVLCGHRGEEAQNAAFEDGASTKRWPDSRHNSYPSLGVDVVPYPVDFEDHERMTFFAGFVLGFARARGTRLRWGGDWDSDTETNDERWRDLGHFEIDD